MKLLNLDDLSGNTRPVQLNGKNYLIHEQSVQQLIDATRAQQAMQEDDAVSMFESLVSNAMAILPDAPEVEIRQLNMRQLQALISFATADDSELEEAAGPEEGK